MSHAETRRKGRTVVDNDDTLEERQRHQRRESNEHRGPTHVSEAPHTVVRGESRTLPPPTPVRPEAEAEDVRSAFSRFYRENVSRIVAYLIYLGAKPEEAAECVQETLIKLLKNWSTVEHPYTWCRTTAAREYIRRRYSSEEPYEDVPATGTPLMAPGTNVDEVLQRHHIAALIDQLPPKQRQVMALTLDGAKPAEIAKDLGLPSDQVRSNLRLARQKLVELVREADRDEEGDR